MRKNRVVWTEHAQIKFKYAYNYYLGYSERSAKSFRTRFFEKIEKLEYFSGIGPIQEFEGSKAHEYRFLLERNYKIIYWISGNTVYLMDVFDTRQNPEKLEWLP